MPIPDVDDMMLPALRLLGDGKPRPVRGLLDGLADYFALSDDERGLRLVSGYRVFPGRARAALSRMRLAGLVEAESRAAVRITALGLETLRSGITALNSKMLSHRGGQDGRLRDPTDATVSFGSARETTEEIMERCVMEARQALALDLIGRILVLRPRFFESLVVDVLVAMGYGGTRAEASASVGMSGDDGLDGLIKADRLGLDRLYLQARRWKQPVGSGAMRAFIDSLDVHGADHGAFITTSSFTAEAHRLADQPRNRRIVLIDGDQLAEFMIEHNVGVSARAAYVIKQVDEDYFSDE